MKNGRSLTDLAAEIERRAGAKKDLVAHTGNIRMEQAFPGSPEALIVGDHRFGVNAIAHGQIATHLEIPTKYYDKMRTDAPGLLANNVNTWFQKNSTPRMVRTIDGTARAFLSDKFSPDMENEDLAEAVLPVLLDMNLAIMSCEITDRRLYIKAVDKKVERALKQANARFGDGGHTIVRVQSPAITISNSEVGMGALSIQGGVYDAFCSNLASFGERSMRRAHVGQKNAIAEGELYAMLSDKSKRLNNAALWSTVRDVVRAVFDKAKFDSLVDKIEGSQADVIEGDVVKVVELSTRKLGLLEAEGKSILKHLVEGASLSRFGLYNAITRAAQDVESYDRATELERVGAQVIELPKAEWKVLAEAA